MTATVLGALLLFSVLAFGSTEAWARSVLQIGIFGLTIARLARGPRMRSTPLAWPFAAIVVWTGIQLALDISVYRHATWNSLVDWSAWLALVALSADTFRDREARNRLLLGAVWAGAAIALAGILQFYTSPKKIYWLFETPSAHSFGPFVNPDHYAAFAELVLPIAVWAALRDRRRALLFLGLAAVIYASVIATGSRAGAILATGEILIVPLLAGRVGSRRATAALAVFAGFATLAGGWQLVWKRFQDSDPYRYRREMALSSLAMIADRPSAGFGLGTFEVVYPSYARFDTGRRVDHAHNDWLEWIAEGGAPMAAALLALAGLGLWRARGVPWSWGLYAVFAHSLVDFPLQIPGIAAMAFVLLGSLSTAAVGD